MIHSKSALALIACLSSWDTCPPIQSTNLNFYPDLYLDLYLDLHFDLYFCFCFSISDTQCVPLFFLATCYLFLPIQPANTKQSEQSLPQGLPLEGEFGGLSVCSSKFSLPILCCLIST